eukprot:6516975-Pyramimonas_sp.AAC.1
MSRSNSAPVYCMRSSALFLQELELLCHELLEGTRLVWFSLKAGLGGGLEHVDQKLPLGAGGALLVELADGIYVAPQGGRVG